MIIRWGFQQNSAVSPVELIEQIGTQTVVPSKAHHEYFGTKQYWRHGVNRNSYLTTLSIIDWGTVKHHEGDLTISVEMIADALPQFNPASLTIIPSLTGEYDALNFGTLSKLISLTAQPPLSSNQAEMVINVDLSGVGLPTLMIGTLEVIVDLTAIPKTNAVGEDCVTKNDELPEPSPGTVRFNRWFI